MKHNDLKELHKSICASLYEADRLRMQTTQASELESRLDNTIASLSDARDNIEEAFKLLQ